MQNRIGPWRHALSRLLQALALVTGTFLAASALAASASAGTLIVQSTTSTRNSGLYDHILPAFEKDTGIKVKVVAVGTGQALKNAARCDGDVLVVHARPDEEAFVAKGYGIRRHPLMHNDFVIVGPKDDPADVRHARSAAEALVRIARAGGPFVSRGDESGTHKKEKALWKAAGIDPTAASGSWYREAGAGMGATLNMAAGMGAYTLSDRGTWLAFNNRGDLALLFSGDPALYNPYGLIIVNPAHCPNVNLKDAQAFRDWLLSEKGQKLIAAYRVNGEQLFFPDALPQKDGEAEKKDK